MGVEEGNYQRKITHAVYRSGPTNVATNYWVGALDNYITDGVINIKEEWAKDSELFEHIDLNYARIPTDAKYHARWGGVIAFVFFVILSTGVIYDLIYGYYVDEFMVFLAIACLALTLMFARYYYTMPDKEFIWNRKDGLITFPGFMWSGKHHYAH